jgi:hypothetical protein
MINLTLAGVPLKASVAGVAMGLILGDDFLLMFLCWSIYYFLLSLLCSLSLFCHHYYC